MSLCLNSKEALVIAQALLEPMRVLVSRLDEADLQEFVGSLRSRIATEKDAPTLERVKKTLRGATSQPPFDWLTTVNP